MKPNFKIDFTKRDVIAMVCFTVVMILVLILGNTFGYVSADDNVSESSYDQGEWYGESVLNYTGWTNSSIYNSDYYFNQGLYSDSTLVSFMNAFNELSIPDTYNYEVVGNFGSVSFSDVPYDIQYLVFRNYSDGSPDTLNFSAIFFGSNNVFNLTDGGIYGLPANDNWVFYLGLKYTKSTDTITITDTVAYLTDTWTQLPYTIYNDVKYYKSKYGGGSVLFGSANIYGYKLGTNSNIGEFIDSGFSSDSYYNVNYMLSDGSFSGGTGGTVSESDFNNMYLNSCEFKFTFNNYVSSTTDDDMKYTGNWNKGNITFNAILNDYQTENLTNFSLKFKFQMLVRGTGYLPFNNPNVDQLDDGHVFYGNFFVEQTKSLSELSSGSISWNADSLWSIMTDENSNVNGSSVSHLSSFLSQVSEYKEIDWSYFKIYATCYLVSDSEGTSDTSRSDSYNFLSGQTTNVSDSLGINYNPYIDSSSGIPSGDDQHIEDSSSSSTTTTGYGTVTQNNNQTVTVNNNVNSSEVTNQLDQILGSTGSDDEVSDGGLTDSFLEKTNSNAWLQLMSTTFGFVPSSIWIDLGVFLVVVLGILAAFLILRFLLDLL